MVYALFILVAFAMLGIERLVTWLQGHAQPETRHRA